MHTALHVRVARVAAFCAIAVAWTVCAEPARAEQRFLIDDKEVAAHKLGVILGNSCDYDWWYGCSPTSAGMIMGHYDRNGYAGLTYNSLVPGGIAEANTFGAGPYLANDIIASSGHVSDFYIGGYEVSGDDAPEPWHPFDCLADFMGTSQDAAGNANGSTTFIFYTNGAPFNHYNVTEANRTQSGMYGVREYLEYVGYGVATLYNQYTDTEGLTFGFTFEQYMAEIDAGRPVIIHVDGHSMFGYGYEAASETVYLHDTWAAGQHSMTWGGSYSGKSHYGVTALEITGGNPVPGPSILTALAGMGAVGLVIRLKRRRRPA